MEFTGWGEGGVSGKGAPSLQPGAGLSSPPPAPPRSSLMGTEVEPLQGPCHGGGGQWQRVEDRRRGQGTVRPPPGRTHRTVLRPQPHPSDPEPGAHQEHPGRDKPGTGAPRRAQGGHQGWSAVSWGAACLLGNRHQGKLCVRLNLCGEGARPGAGALGRGDLGDLGLGDLQGVGGTWDSEPGARGPGTGSWGPGQCDMSGFSFAESPVAGILQGGEGGQRTHPPCVQGAILYLWPPRGPAWAPGISGA